MLPAGTPFSSRVWARSVASDMLPVVNLFSLPETRMSGMTPSWYSSLARVAMSVNSPEPPRIAMSARAGRGVSRQR